MKHTHTLIYLILIFSACGQKKDSISTSSDDMTYICWDSLSRKDNIFERRKFIKLETTDSSLISGIERIEKDGNLLFLLDSNQKIFVFDTNGKFQETIGKIGPGPGEQLNFFDFYLDREKNTVNVLDMFRTEIFEYDYDGMLKSKTKLEKDMLANVDKISKLYDGKLLFTFDNSNRSLYNYGVANLKEKTVTKLLRYIATGKLTMATMNKVVQFQNRIFATAYLSDTIYEYKDCGLKAKYIFKGPLKPLNSDYLNDNYEIGAEAERIATKNNLSIGIYDLYVKNSCMYFNYYVNNNRYAILYDIEEESGYYKKFGGDFDSEILRHIISSSDDTVISLIDIEDLKEIDEHLSDIYPEAKAILKKSCDDDNPILVFSYFK